MAKGIILAAGTGSRLRPLTDDRPKCLLEVGGRTLIDRQLTTLDWLGVHDVIVVVGYHGAVVRTHLGSRVRYIANPRYAVTNSLYSLWLARDELRSGALILNADVLAAPALFERLWSAPARDAVLVDLNSGLEPEDMKVTLRGTRVTDFGKTLAPERAHAHNVGMAKFGPEGAAFLALCLDRLVATGHQTAWVPAAYREFASHRPLVAVPTAGLPWIEIDFAEDLDRARVEVEPALPACEPLVAV